jgi:hypothetical protein
MPKMKFEKFVEWAENAEFITVDGNLSQILTEKWDDGTVCAIHFVDHGVDIQDLDMDDDLDRFGHCFLNAYIGDSEIQYDFGSVAEDGFKYPSVTLYDERTEEEFHLIRFKQERVSA